MSKKNSIDKENTKIGGFFKNNKKKIFIIIGILVFILLIFLIIFSNRDNKDNNELINVEYKNGKVISYNKFDNSFKEKRTIIVENKNNFTVNYSLKWYKVTNTLKKQNNFLYEISCTGDRCKELGTSQIPVVDAPVFEQVKIRPNSKQVYTINIIYKGKEKKVKFKGKLLAKISEKKEN